MALIFVEVIMSLFGVPTNPVYELVILTLAGIIFLEILLGIFKLIYLVISPMREI
jgi:hypothetical protein